MTVSPAQPNAASAQAYEELRQHVLTESAAGSHFGLVLILREGVAAWMARCATHPDPSFASLELDRPAVPRLSDEVSASVVRVLASMVLAGRLLEVRI